jgi:hypothetical protein
MPAFSGLDLKIVCVKIFFHDCVPGSVWFFFNRSWIRVGFFRRWIFGFLQDTGPLTGFGIRILDGVAYH